MDKYVTSYIEVNPSIFEKISISQKKKYAESIQKIKLNAVNIDVEQSTNKDVVYEILDYNCIYCKKFHHETSGWIKKNTEYKIHYIQLPIISDSSFFISKLFLEVGYISKSKQQELHEKLMLNSKHISEQYFHTILESIGLDVSEVKKVASVNGIDIKLKETIQLAKYIGITGTPAFIKDNNIIIGSQNRMNFLKFINKSSFTNQI